MAIDYSPLANAIVDADMEESTAFTQKFLDEGQANEGMDELTSCKATLNQGLIGGMDIIADLWAQEKIFIPEVLLSARCMHSCMDILRPILEASKEPPRGVVVIGTVKGDLHDIGQNIVGMMLKGNGYEVHNIGPNSSPEKFMDKAREVGATIIGLSALLTTTMPMQRETIREFDEAGLLDRMVIIVGGAPVTADWAEKIDSDGYAPDAAHAVQLSKLLMEDLEEELAAN